jgi:hypothetical protein
MSKLKKKVTLEEPYDEPIMAKTQTPIEDLQCPHCLKLGFKSRLTYKAHLKRRPVYCLNAEQLLKDAEEATASAVEEEDEPTENDILTEQVSELTVMMSAMHDAILRMSIDIVKLKNGSSPTKSIGGGSRMSGMSGGSRLSDISSVPADFVPFAIIGTAVYDGVRRNVFYGKQGAKQIQPSGKPSGAYEKGLAVKYLKSSVALASTYEAIEDTYDEDEEEDEDI